MLKIINALSVLMVSNLIVKVFVKSKIKTRKRMILAALANTKNLLRLMVNADAELLTILMNSEVVYLLGVRLTNILGRISVNNVQITV